MKRLRRVVVALALSVALFPALFLGGWALSEPLPGALLRGEAKPSLSVLDRDGRLLREIRGGDGRSLALVPLGQVAPTVTAALIANEDARFHHHPGIDPLAMARAAVQALRRGRVVSGASTITQQLARALVPRPRSLLGKLHEMALALRIEASLDKRQILEAYANFVEFAPGAVGVEAASRAVFDKPAANLDLAEAATLVGMLKNPVYFDARRFPTRALRRRDAVLARMADTGHATSEAVERARGATLTPTRASAEASALHLALGVASGALAPELRGLRAVSVRTSLALELEREVETITRRYARELEAVNASAVAVLVVDNHDGSVLAHLGSPDYFARAAGGSNDGTRALRQPGSALKPFVYAAALAKLGWDLATIVPDLPLSLSTPNGAYSPENYDGKVHGPVRLRVALGSSLNLPALHTVMQVGAGEVLASLRNFGFTSLEREPGYYGAGIALGDGEVRLSELAAAYSTLARDGEFLPLRYTSRARLADGSERAFEPPAPRRVVEPEVARQITDALADDAARSQAFGLDSALAFDFPLAAKTGTSKGFRDNWAVGYTREVTVAVWVGNFDGRPLVRSSGVSGAGPIFHDVMLAAMRGRTPKALVTTGAWPAQELCAQSGDLATSACAARVREPSRPGRARRALCTLHERIEIDPANGLLAGPACSGREARVFERYPRAFEAWARAAHRPLAPSESSPRCPAIEQTGHGALPLAIAWPRSGQRFVLDPERPRQEIVVEAERPRAAERVTLWVDGREVAAVKGGRATWALVRGEHELELRGAAAASAKVRVSVTD